MQLPNNQRLIELVNQSSAILQSQVEAIGRAYCLGVHHLRLQECRGWLGMVAGRPLVREHWRETIFSEQLCNTVRPDARQHPGGLLLHFSVHSQL